MQEIPKKKKVSHHWKIKVKSDDIIIVFYLLISTYLLHYFRNIRNSKNIIGQFLFQAVIQPIKNDIRIFFCKIFGQRKVVIYIFLNFYCFNNSVFKFVWLFILIIKI